MKKLIQLLICFLCTFSTYASHFSGGEIRYEFNGTNYDVYLTVYKVCESTAGAPLPNSVTINVQSVNNATSFTQALTFIGFDTIDINCPSSTNFCHNPTTGTLPGYIQAKFKSTITLPSQASDWHISWQNCCRISGILNGASGQSFYIDTWLDNTAAINSNARMTTAPSYYISANDTAVIPLQTIDPDGDSIAYKIIEPLSAVGTSITYAPLPYSLTNPLGPGGICKIDAATHTLMLKSPTQGMFDVAFVVEEYRHGVKVGSYIRDITFAVVPSTPKLSYPKQSTTNPTFVYTCPGQSSNSIVLNFTDPTSTDSVYLDVVTPALTGWTFNKVISNGSPSASATITWSTPSVLNPATLPYFYVTVKARDNACPSSKAEYSVLVRTRQCNADTVWPGDANGDFTVNIYDPLAIAIAAGQTGPTRTGATISWTPQYCANWATTLVTNNTNMKHADCNGDGTVNNSDLTAVTANYSLSHPKGGRSKTTGINDLYFDMTGINMTPGAHVSIPIKLGSSTQSINNIYAIATQVQLDGLPLTAAPTITNNNSWLDNSSSAVNFNYGVNNTTVDWVLGRTNQQNVSGQGTIGTLNFTVPTSLTIGAHYQLSFVNTVLIDKDGVERYDINQVEATGTLQQSNGVAGVVAKINAVSIVPNPSGNTAHVNMSLKADADVNVTVSDVTGKVVWSVDGNYAKGEHSIALPAGNLAGGMYVVRLSTGEGNTSVMKWIKQ
ncbi:MAG: T9SS type A sorting domain-containing protein [Chitinophagales bacterium]|nr:T9SS type A sorting domain-containing protein [Chitinophagales bacterium]